MEQDLDNLYDKRRKESLSDSSEENIIRKKVKMDRNVSTTIEVEDHNNASELEDILFFKQTDNDFSEWVPPHIDRSKNTSTHNPSSQLNISNEGPSQHNETASIFQSIRSNGTNENHQHLSQNISGSQNKNYSYTSSISPAQYNNNVKVQNQTLKKEEALPKPLPKSGIAKKSGKGGPPRDDRLVPRPPTEPKEVVIHDIPLSDNPTSASRRPVATPKARVNFTKIERKPVSQPQISSQAQVVQEHKSNLHSVPVFSKPSLPSYMANQLNQHQKEAYLSIKRPQRGSDLKLFQQSTPQQLKEFITKELETEQDEQEEISIQQLIHKYTERNRYRTIIGLKLHENFDQIESQSAKVVNCPVNYRYFL